MTTTERTVAIVAVAIVVFLVSMGLVSLTIFAYEWLREDWGLTPMQVILLYSSLLTVFAVYRAYKETD
jgi:hypothetical protein